MFTVAEGETVTIEFRVRKKVIMTEFIALAKQKDGSRHTQSLFPDEEVLVTVKAPGCESNTHTLKLSEGVVKELVVKLKPVAAKPGRNSG